MANKTELDFKRMWRDFVMTLIVSAAIGMVTLQWYQLEILTKIQLALVTNTERDAATVRLVEEHTSRIGCIEGDVKALQLDVTTLKIRQENKNSGG